MRVPAYACASTRVYSRATRARHARAVKLLVNGTVHYNTPFIPPFYALQQLDRHAAVDRSHQQGGRSLLLPSSGCSRFVQLEVSATNLPHHTHQAQFGELLQCTDCIQLVVVRYSPFRLHSAGFYLGGWQMSALKKSPPIPLGLTLPVFQSTRNCMSPPSE